MSHLKTDRVVSDEYAKQLEKSLNEALEEVLRLREALSRIHRGEQPAHKIAADALFKS